MNPLTAAYFDSHPDARDGVIKAYYAYHAGHFRTNPYAHNFPNEARECKCAWCGRSRQEVRQDDLPPYCMSRPELPDVAETIHAEELKAFKLLENAEPIVQKTVTKEGLSGATLAYLKQTHGIDPDFACDILGVPFESHRQQYEQEQQKHSELARAAFKPEVVKVKT